MQTTNFLSSTPGGVRTGPYKHSYPVPWEKEVLRKTFQMTSEQIVP